MLNLKKNLTAHKKKVILFLFFCEAVIFTYNFSFLNLSFSLLNIIEMGTLYNLQGLSHRTVNWGPNIQRKS